MSETELNNSDEFINGELGKEATELSFLFAKNNSFIKIDVVYFTNCCDEISEI